MCFTRRLFSSNFGRRGLPFLLMVAGGSFALSLVTDARYKVSQHNRTLGLTKEQMKLQGWKEDNVDIVDEFKSMQEHLDIDNWENVRGPRPWEEDSVKYKEIIEKRVKEHEERRKKTGIFWVA